MLKEAALHFLYDIKSTIDQGINQQLVKKRWDKLEFDAGLIQQLGKQLKPASPYQKVAQPPLTLLPKERELIQTIRQQTKEMNRNNVTRTNAYWEIYTEHPELHWSFLAHMVSRNGGWSMTDLKGDLLPLLLNQEQIHNFFLFLESCNSYIFQDAYPQLLLYRESKRKQKSMFHLLPAFHVSRFMQPFWDYFWQKQDSQVLTVALIINEQNYIEKRVVQHAAFQHKVFNTLPFHAQSLLQLTQVFFPYTRNKKLERQRLRLAGLAVSDFTSLNDRIEVGKRLYGILFGLEDVYKGTLQYARVTPHTGSRADYWPTVFSKKPTILSDSPPTQNRLAGCTLKKGAPAYYSPTLSSSWPDQSVAPPERYDWFHDRSALDHFSPTPIKREFEMTKEFCSGLKKLEMAVIAAQNLIK